MREQSLVLGEVGGEEEFEGVGDCEGVEWLSSSKEMRSNESESMELFIKPSKRDRLWL